MSIAPLPERRDIDARTFREEIVSAYAPVVLRGFAADWPAVRAAASLAEARAYLGRFDRGAIVEAFIGPPGIKGRFFYADDMRGFNFERRKVRLGDALRVIESQPPGREAPAIYVGAAAVPECLPGFAEENPNPLVPAGRAVPRIWIGNETIVSTHFDLSDNIAVVAAGRRRFTLFPPDQLPNLYVGPLDHNMAGQPASLVDLAAPDPERFPKFAEALTHARTAELEPGDAIYIPTLWWHQIEALSPFNILVNYWWDDQPADAGSPFEAMVHAIHAVRGLPPAQREAWRGWFDHYVFAADDPAAHIDPPNRGILGESTPGLRQRLRQFLMRGLARKEEAARRGDGGISHG